MAKPTASFEFKPNGLSVQFTDRSSGSPTSWAWDFGDGTDPDTNQSPNHIFVEARKYDLSFTATNDDGEDTITYELIVSETPTIGSSIKEMVEYDLPGVTGVDGPGFLNAVRKWQLYFQPCIPMEDMDVFDESKWPPLWNVLISKLVDYDLIIRGIPFTTGGSSTSSSGGSTGGTGKGPLKSLEAGPSKASWYDPSTYWSNIFKSTAGGSPSIIASVQQQACIWSDRVGVQLDFCPNRKTVNTKVFINSHLRTIDCFPSLGFCHLISKG